MHTVRKTLPGELGKYLAHLKALDAESRMLRFGCAAHDEYIDRFIDTVRKKSKYHTIFAIENSALEFVGVGHIATEVQMELAFSVLKDHQGQGMGNSLMQRCIQHCRVIGQRKGVMQCLNHNIAIKHLCLKNGIHLTSAQGETLANIELDHPDLITYWKEAADSNLAVLDYTLKRI